MMALGLDEIELLEAQMRQVRRSLEDDVHGLVVRARAMTDWRQHWKKHQWIGCAAVMALGYLVVPARRIGSAEFRRLEELAQVSASNSRASPTRPLLFQLGGMALGFVVQRGLHYVGERVDQFLASSKSSGTNESRSRGARYGREK